jgi:hypothetical protein
MDGFKEALLALADYAYGVAGDEPSDDAVFKRLIDRLKGAAGTPDFGPLDMAMTSMLSRQDQMLSMLALVRWAQAGYPQYVLGHKYAAALCVTGATAEAVDLAQLPFDAVLIAVPDGLLHMVHPVTSEPDPIRWLLVARYQSKKAKDGRAWCYSAYSSAGNNLYRYGVDTADLLPPVGGTMDQSLPLPEADSRTMAVIGKLIVNVCLALSDPSRVRAIGSGHQTRPKAKGSQRQAPATRVFQVGSPVRHDFREHVAAFTAGKVLEISVQSFVAGHYKMQPHGPRNALRKLIWLEPYWRGPEEAPIALRPHKLAPQP